MEPVLSCRDIRKTFHRAVVPSVLLQDHVLRRHQRTIPRSIMALDGVSLDLNKGEWLGIYGHNGSGKTTLLRILAELMPPDSGSLDIRGSLNCFFDLSLGFHSERSADENIYFHGLLHGLSGSQIRALTDQIVSFAGIESHRDLPFKCYSTGMKLRLAFSSIAHVHSDIYLLDEITAVGDAEFQQRCMDQLLKMKAEGKSAILVNHSLAQMSKLCDRVIVMDQGKVVDELSADVVAQRVLNSVS